MTRAFKRLVYFWVFYITTVSASEADNPYASSSSNATASSHEAITRPDLFQYPLIIGQDILGPRINPIYYNLLADGVLEFIDLSYELAKEYSSDLKLRLLSLDSLDSAIDSTMALRTKHSQYIRNAAATTINLEARGWKIEKFYGKTGLAKNKEHHGDIDDLRGVAAEKNGVIIVAPHGSKDSFDWEVNLDALVVPASNVGLSINGNPLIHQGFGHAVASFQTNLEYAIKKLAGQSREYSIVVIGHSQGAAIAAILLMSLAGNFAKHVWGNTYSNIKEHRIKGLLFGAPRAIAERSLSIFNTIVGKENVIRQNVDLDPVPILSPRKHIPLLDLLVLIAKRAPPTASLIHGKPQFASLIRYGTKEYVGLAGVGYLALDNTVDIIARSEKITTIQDLLGPVHYVKLFPDGGFRFNPNIFGSGHYIHRSLRTGVLHEYRQHLTNHINSTRLHETLYIVSDVALQSVLILHHFTSALTDGSDLLMESLYKAAFSVKIELNTLVQQMGQTKNILQLVKALIFSTVTIITRIVSEISKGFFKASPFVLVALSKSLLEIIKNIKLFLFFVILKNTYQTKRY